MADTLRAGAVKPGSHREDLRPTLNSDGKRHTAQNLLTLFVFVGGIVVFACGLIVKAHSAASFLGVAVFVLGLFGQLMSSNREQRVLLVAGIIAAFVGLAMGIAHGGFV